MTKHQTPEQIKTRLEEIEAEQAELSSVDHDALMAKAIVAGSDLDAIEEDQAKAERRQRRLRIEHETLTGMLPEAERLEIQPKLDQMQKDHAAKIKEAAKAASAALDHWRGLKDSLEILKNLRAETTHLTLQAVTLADSVGAPDPALEMGPPLSRQLSQTGEYMKYAGAELQNWASLPVRGNGKDYGVSVDPKPAPVRAA